MDYKIDEKDRKIISQIDKNSRATDSQIAKEVGLSKQVVSYRIQNLEKNKILLNYHTILDVATLGLSTNYIFLQLQKINKKQEEELLEKINKLDYIGWLTTSLGRWDVFLSIYSKNIEQYNYFLNELLEICGDYIHEYEQITHISSVQTTYKSGLKEQNFESIEQTSNKDKVQLNKIEKNILIEISQNAKKSIVEISNNLKIPVHTINYHLKKLLKNKIITGFKTKIDVSKLGYSWYSLMIKFDKSTPQRQHEFISYCKKHKQIYYITHTIGIYNSTLDIHVKTPREFREVLFELKEKFSDLIKIYETALLFDEIKINYIPKTLI